MATSYTELYNYIKSASENDDAEFASAIPTFIDQTRMRLARDIDTYGFVVYTTVTAVSANPFVSVPSDALVLKAVTYVSAGRYSQLIMRTDEFLREYWPQRTSVGEPKYYARWGSGQLLMAPAPSASATLEVSYVQIPTSIGSVGTSHQLAHRVCSRGPLLRVHAGSLHVHEELPGRCPLGRQVPGRCCEAPQRGPPYSPG